MLAFAATVFGPRIIFVAALSVATATCSAERASSADGGPAGAVAREWPFERARAPAYSRDGMIATTDRVASEVGVEILRRGGNSVDAAVAVHFALAVVNPEAGNIGGGGFMIVRMANGRAFALDFREKAPLAARRDMYLAPGGALTDRSVVGHAAAGVPGSVSGMWEAHRRFGTLAWAELLAPAITLAEGLVVHERLAESLDTHRERLLRFPSTSAIFLSGGRAPRVGDRLAQRDLAATLRRIAAGGRDGFYGGETARLIEAEMRRGGGFITREDLAGYAAVWRDPIVFHSYRDHTVISMPPPSSGGATLAELLNILEGYDLAALGYLTAEHAHLWTEASKRAFADRNSYLADPDFVTQPIARMISDAYAAERRGRITRDRATPTDGVRPGLDGPRTTAGVAAALEGEHTTHYSIVDRAGNAVAVTTTINSLYGNLVTVTGAGFLLNNEMDDFAARPGSPNQFGLVQGEANAIEPGKRMLSAMTPTILVDASGRLRLVTGSPGGPTIITTVAQLISNIVDFEMDIATATAAPRLHHQHLPDVLQYENGGLQPQVESALRALGHDVAERPGYQGGAQSIVVMPDGTLAGVADPRRGGAAMGVRRIEQVVQ